MCEPEGSGPAGVEDLPVLPEPLRGAAAGPGRAVGLPGGARGGVREVLPPAAQQQHNPHPCGRDTCELGAEWSSEDLHRAIGVMLVNRWAVIGQHTLHSGRNQGLSPTLSSLVAWCHQIFFVNNTKIFVTPSVLKLQKWFLHQNGVESKSDMCKLLGGAWRCRSYQKMCSSWPLT